MRTTVNIRTDKGPFAVTPLAVADGLAVTRWLRCDYSWHPRAFAITHVPSGQKVNMVPLDYARAMKMLKRLRQLRIDWRTLTSARAAKCPRLGKQVRTIEAQICR